MGCQLPDFVRETWVLPGLAKKFAVPAEQLMAFVHYHPTFWYFHLHIVNSRHAMFSGDASQNLLLTAMDRFHKLETIIALLEGNPTYYKSAKLSVLLQPQQVAWYAAEAK